jgi:hypothetical protein
MPQFNIDPTRFDPYKNSGWPMPMVGYITFKPLEIEPDYMQGPNPDGPASLSVLLEDFYGNRNRY